MGKLSKPQIEQILAGMNLLTETQSPTLSPSPQSPPPNHTDGTGA